MIWKLNAFKKNNVKVDAGGSAKAVMDFIQASLKADLYKTQNLKSLYDEYFFKVLAF